MRDVALLNTKVLAGYNKVKTSKFKQSKVLFRKTTQQWNHCAPILYNSHYIPQN